MAKDESKNIIDSIQWLHDRSERSLREGDSSAAAYLERILIATDDPHYLLYAHSNLGILAFRRRDLDEARYHFDEAGDIAPKDPSVAYAKGHCEAAVGDWWQALIYFVEAAFYGRRHAEEVEFLRSTAVALKNVGYTDQAHIVMLGALERQPTNPHLLESLGRYYEDQEQWLDAIRVRDDLIEILKGNDPRHRIQQFSPAMDGTPIDEEVIRERVRSINNRLRKEFEVVDEQLEIEEPDASMSTTSHAPGLHTLVVSLSQRAYPRQLLETAQSLWARARHDRFDVHLNPYTLAAAIQCISERVHWREPTSSAELKRLYDVDQDRVRAAVRLIVSRFEVKIIDVQPAYTSLASNRVAHLQKMLQARLFDVDLDELEPVKMLM